LNRTTLAWASRRAVRLAVGTCVVALILATTLSGDAAERFATVAYLAAIFAAVGLVAGRFLPNAAADDSAVAVAAFPAFLSTSFVVLLFVSVAAILVSQPGAEVFLLIACALLVFVVVLFRCGALAAFGATLTRGGVIIAASRIAVLLGVCALALGAVLGGYTAETIVAFAFRVAVAATLLVAASLLTPTKAGIFVQSAYLRTVAALDRLARAFVFERTASYAAIVAVAAIVPATFLPEAYCEPFAIAAYAAALAAAFGVAMECRRLRS
jgi:hypothetical protein